MRSLSRYQQYLVSLHLSVVVPHQSAARPWFAALFSGEAKLCGRQEMCDLDPLSTEGSVVMTKSSDIQLPKATRRKVWSQCTRGRLRTSRNI